MIVLDTTVLTEPLRPRPDARVVAWLDAQVVEALYLTTIALAEIRFAISALPEGKRRESLHGHFEDEVVPLFHRRILTFDERASAVYATICNAAQCAGQPLPDIDALIAAIAKSHDQTVVTRDTAPFIAARVPVINPFEG